jgi:hypothetical protein
MIAQRVQVRAQYRIPVGYRLMALEHAGSYGPTAGSGAAVPAPPPAPAADRGDGDVQQRNGACQNSLPSPRVLRSNVRRALRS